MHIQYPISLSVDEEIEKTGDGACDCVNFAKMGPRLQKNWGSRTGGQVFYAYTISHIRERG